MPIKIGVPSIDKIIDNINDILSTIGSQMNKMSKKARVQDKHGLSLILDDSKKQL